MNRFSDRRKVSPKKLFGFWIWRIFYTDLRILLVQRIADLSNIFAQIVDLPCNLIRILDCDFIVELLVDPNLDKTIVGSANFVLKSTDLYTPINHPPLPIILIICQKKLCLQENAALAHPLKHGTHDAPARNSINFYTHIDPLKSKKTSASVVPLTSSNSALYCEVVNRNGSLRKAMYNPMPSMIRI